MSLQIIDNFLDENYFKKLNQEFLSIDFPWYFQNGRDYKNDGDFQYTHIFYSFHDVNSNYFKILEPFLNLLDIKSLVRIKVNLTSKDSVLRQGLFHTDFDFQFQ